MNIQDNYLKNKKNIFFSENKDIQTHREKLINIFENDRFDKKNNESLKNTNIKNFIDFKYKYLIPEETSVINNYQKNRKNIFFFRKQRYWNPQRKINKYFWKW